MSMKQEQRENYETERRSGCEGAIFKRRRKLVEAMGNKFMQARERVD